MSQKKLRIVVVCPGRGTYTKTELGYLKKYRPQFNQFFGTLDSYRSALGLPTVSELDDAPAFSAKTHTPGENASLLIYACSTADFFSINPEKYEIVAVTGNSMGWYTTLGLAGGLDKPAAMNVINSMGSMMRGGTVGGQVIYPVVDDQWHRDGEKIAAVDRALAAVNAALPQAWTSIHFGGYAVIGGTQEGLNEIMKLLPKVEDRYPFQLINHAAFHTPLLANISEQAFDLLPEELFKSPQIPMIDGRGYIWQPLATDPGRLREYTLGHQVTETYDFTQAVSVALKEFAPDRLVLLGPGSTSGGALGQILVSIGWKGIGSKLEFSNRQETEPFLLAMGREEQRNQLI